MATHRLADLEERDVDRNQAHTDEAGRGHVEVAAGGLAGVTGFLAPLEGDGAAHGDDALSGGEHHADPIVGLHRHDPLLAQAPAGVVGRGFVRCGLGQGRGVGMFEVRRMVHGVRMAAPPRPGNGVATDHIRISRLRSTAHTEPEDP